MPHGRVDPCALLDPWSRLNQRTILFFVNKFGHSATIPQLEKYLNLRAEDIAAHILHFLNLPTDTMEYGINQR